METILINSLDHSPTYANAHLNMIAQQKKNTKSDNALTQNFHPKKCP